MVDLGLFCGMVNFGFMLFYEEMCSKSFIEEIVNWQSDEILLTLNLVLKVFCPALGLYVYMYKGILLYSNTICQVNVSGPLVF